MPDAREGVSGFEFEGDNYGPPTRQEILTRIFRARLVP